MPEASPVTLRLASLAETEALAARVAGALCPGDLVLLRGDLGAGKTTFTRALVCALGSPALVSSPTFALIHEYGGGRLPVVHADAYRLRGAEEAEGIGLEEYLSRGDGVTLIEWPERVEALLPPERLEITLTPGEGEEERTVTLSPRGARWEGLREAGDPLC